MILHVNPAGKKRKARGTYRQLHRGPPRVAEKNIQGRYRTHRTALPFVSSSLATRSSFEFFFRIGENTTKGYGMAQHKVQISKELIAEFCRRHHIRRLSFFGSILREDFRTDSDVDVLVEFEPDREVGLFRLAAMERELSGLLGGRKADIRTPEDLSRYFRHKVMSLAEVQYAGE